MCRTIIHQRVHPGTMHFSTLLILCVFFGVTSTLKAFINVPVHRGMRRDSEEAAVEKRAARSSSAWSASIKRGGNAW